jgi:hypothetical protein
MAIMTSCRACGAMISAEASACPRCGAISSRTVVAPVGLAMCSRSRFCTLYSSVIGEPGVSKAFAVAGHQSSPIAPRCSTSSLHPAAAFKAGREAALRAAMGTRDQARQLCKAARIDNGRVQLLTRPI